MTDKKLPEIFATFEERTKRVIKHRALDQIMALPATQKPTAEQKGVLESGRFGDLTIPDWEKGRNEFGDVVCLCSCGERVNFPPEKLHALLASEWDGRYVSPAPPEIQKTDLQPYWCPHIRQELEERYPSMAEELEEFRRQFRRKGNKGRSQYALGWFDRSFGLSYFITSVGLPPQAGMRLARVGPSFDPSAYNWVLGGAPEKVDDGARSKFTPGDLRKLSSRFTSLKSRVLAEERVFHWNTFNEFLTSLVKILPADFSLEEYQVRFSDAGILGYGEDSLFLHRVGSQKEKVVDKDRYDKAPWNVVAEIESMAREWPLLELDLSPRQYVWFVAEMVRLSSQPYDGQELIRDALNSARQQEIEDDSTSVPVPLEEWLQGEEAPPPAE